MEDGYFTRARHDAREFAATFFALRIGLVFSALMVMLAPALAWVYENDFPPSISDAWWTDARTVFVVGLAAALALLVVVRGDTLTEQTLLNVAGVLGFVVAAVACVPEEADGMSLASYDPAVLHLNKVALNGLLIILPLVWWAGFCLLPMTWNVRTWPRRILEGTLPCLLAAGALWFLLDPDTLAGRAHFPAALAMFTLLGLVALLRTSIGARLLALLGDTPVDASLTSKHLAVRGDEDTATSRFDALYNEIAYSMVSTAAAAGVFTVARADTGWILAVEVAFLLLFLVFWVAQTREAWLETQDG